MDRSIDATYISNFLVISSIAGLYGQITFFDTDEHEEGEYYITVQDRLQAVMFGFQL